MRRTMARHTRNLVASVVLTATALSVGLVVADPGWASVSAAATTGGHGQQATTTARKEHAAAGSTAATHNTATARPRTWGVANPDLPGNPDAMRDLTTETGSTPGVVMWYVAWSLRSAFPTADADRVRSWGSTPEITWEPWDPSAGVDQPAYSLAQISQGSFDTYLTQWARAIAAWNHPLRLRFAHEMNGSWYPWDQGVNGNGPGSYVAAWTHVHDIFAAAGATKVRWVWSPNVPFPGSTPLSQLFPGDALVNEVALDGYNWGTMQGGRWTSFAGVFAAGVRQLTALSRRPISIGEVGCPQSGGAKDVWVRDMWKTLSTWPRVRGLMWFDFDKEADWRIDSSNSSLLAFRDGVHAYLAG